MRQRTYTTDRQWADAFAPQVRAILLQHLHVFATVADADRNTDIQCIGDFTVTVDMKHVLCRIRDTGFRDLTLRSFRTSGATTEVAKILAGNGRWYFYGWITANTITDWMLVDLDVLRATGLIQQAPVINNHDGKTGFIAIPRHTLEEHDAIIVQHEPIIVQHKQGFSLSECDTWLLANGWTITDTAYTSPEGHVHPRDPHIVARMKRGR